MKKNVEVGHHMTYRLSNKLMISLYKHFNRYRQTYRVSALKATKWIKGGLTSDLTLVAIYVLFQDDRAQEKKQTMAKCVCASMVRCLAWVVNNDKAR